MTYQNSPVWATAYVTDAPTYQLAKHLEILEPLPQHIEHHTNNLSLTQNPHYHLQRHRCVCELCYSVPFWYGRTQRDLTALGTTVQNRYMWPILNNVNIHLFPLQWEILTWKSIITCPSYSWLCNTCNSLNDRHWTHLSKKLTRHIDL